jgi:hypothetical protein
MQKSERERRNSNGHIVSTKPRRHDRGPAVSGLRLRLQSEFLAGVARCLHHIDGEDRPLLRGETFHEQWHIKRGEIRLAWTVTESDPPSAWTVEADTDFIGRIVIRYTFEAIAAGTKYTRTLRNPDRPSEPSPGQIARMDEEAMIGLQNIKRNVEKRFLALSESGRA